MKCELTYLVLAICLGLGSSMELNETSYTAFPPLYHFDEWIQCQRPKDVYCMVDAVLFSSTPSPLLDYIKEYSAHTQKHFNRTVIHRGLCMRRCGADGPDTWHDAAQRCINKSLAEYGLEAKVLPIRFCSSPEVKEPSMSAKAFRIVYLTILALTLLATGLHVLGQRYDDRRLAGIQWISGITTMKTSNIPNQVKIPHTRVKPIPTDKDQTVTDFAAVVHYNKYILALSLKRNWQVLTSVRSNEELKKQKTYCDLSCFEGIRFIGMIGVLLTHVSLVYVHSYIDNPEFFEHMFETFSGKAAFNSPLWMQVFFSITGFLTTYLVLVYSEKSSLTFFKCCLAILNRYIRITPVALFTLWFAMTWYPRLGSGPHWMLQSLRESQDCAKHWWYHILYVHNFLPLGKFCMGHTWYLGADMQLHILGMFLLLLFIRWRRTVKPVLFLILLGFIVSCGLLAYFYNVTPIITAQTPESVLNMFKGSQVLKILYLPFWMNFAGYFLGVATAFIFYNNQVNGVKLSEIKWFNILFHLTLVIAGIVSLLGVVFLGEKKPPRLVEIIYISLDRFIIALCFNILILGCVSNCKSIIRSLLFWPGFRMLGRLSYSVFMIHVFILRFSFDTNTQLGHVTTYSMISMLIGGLVTAYIVAIPIYLIIEMPPLQLWKAFLSNEKPKASQESPIKLNSSSRQNDIPA